MEEEKQKNGSHAKTAERCLFLGDETARQREIDKIIPTLDSFPLLGEGKRLGLSEVADMVYSEMGLAAFTIGGFTSSKATLSKRIAHSGNVMTAVIFTRKKMHSSDRHKCSRICFDKKVATFLVENTRLACVFRWNIQVILSHQNSAHLM